MSHSPQSSTSTNSGPFSRAEYIEEESSILYCCPITPSISTADCDPSYVASDEPELPKESAWRTAYGAARMAVEIAAKSSNMFPLLKAVTGALSVFTRNYDVSSS